VTKKNIFIQLIIVLGLCLCIEAVSFFVVRAQQMNMGFLFNLNGRNEVNEVKGFGFNEIDPLCGWAMSNESIAAMGYDTLNNCEVLRSKGAFPVNPIKILITGGSTSDIALHKDNWPIQLQQILSENQINAVIYAGGVGGYSSGQELLKLLRDGLAIDPDIHISYAGANEAGDGGYVSTYEHSFYQTAYRQNFTTPIMPSTVYLLKKLLRLNYSGLSIKQATLIQPYDFWRQNMQVMSAIAMKQKHRFFGVLQPVFVMSKIEQQKGGDVDPGGYGKEYLNYYPKARLYISQTDSSLIDFTSIFDTIQGQVYIDDCHINEPYQRVVALNIFNVLSEAGCFNLNNKRP
jgi:hypothetical protein